MTKEQNLLVRVSTQDKAAVKAAAARLEQSVTTFVTEAVMHRVRHVERLRPPQGVHEGVPSFFRACCIEAANGGESGYFGAGLRLAGSLGDQMPYSLEWEQWKQEVEQRRT